MSKTTKTYTGKQNEIFQNRTEWDLIDRSLLLEVD